MRAVLVAGWMFVAGTTPPPTLNCPPLHAAVIAGNRSEVQRLAGRRLLGMGTPTALLEERGELVQPPTKSLGVALRQAPGTCYRRTALMVAAQEGQLESAQILISSGASLSATALLPELGDELIDARCLAIVNGREMTRVALEKAGAPTGACTDNARLFAAITARDVDLVELQLRAPPSQATLLAAMGSLIGKAAGKTLDLLIQAGLTAKVDFAPIYGQAVAARDVQTVKQLSDAGARIQEFILLPHAIELQQGAMVPSLLAAGARTDTPNVHGAIQVALSKHETDALRALLDAGYRGDDEIPLLLYALRYYPPIAMELVGKGVAVEVDDLEGVTPLMAAAAAGDFEMMKALIERGASLRTGDITCQTAIDSTRTPRKLQRQLTEAKIDFKQPAVPGRAARRMGVTCGTALLSITFDARYEIYLPTGLLPMRAGATYRVDPGMHALRVREIETGKERKATVKLVAGENTITENFYDFSSKPVEAAAPHLLPLTLDQATIARVVRGYQSDLASCLATQHKLAPGRAGTLRMQWTILTNGSTTDVKPVDYLNGTMSMSMAGCMTMAIREWKFPAHQRQGSRIVFPFKY